MLPRQHFSTLCLALALASLATLAALAPQPACAEIVWVGGDEACRFDNLADALQYTHDNGPDFDEIRLAPSPDLDGAYYGWYLIEDQNVNLLGGYPRCGETSPRSTTKMVRYAGTRNFVVRSAPLAESWYQVYFERLVLVSDGTGPSGFAEGDSIHLSGSNHLTLAATVVDGGHAVRGGGIFIDGMGIGVDTDLYLTKGTILQKNSADEEGGAIACRDFAGIYMDYDSLIVDNSAKRGGGLYLDDCVINVEPQHRFAGILRNSAVEGGGAYLRNGGSIDLDGNMHENKARRGGGIFGTGEQVRVRMDGGAMFGNVAEEAGGALYAEHQIQAVFDAYSGCTGRDLAICSAVSGNQAPLGSAAYARAGAEVWFFRARLADNLGKTLVTARGTDTEIRLNTTEVVGNTADLMIDLGSGATLLSTFVTVADNHPLDQEVWIFHDNPASVVFENSIFWDDDGLIHDTSYNLPGTWDCLVVWPGAQPGGGAATKTDDPDFTDAAGRDFTLGMNSSAVDFCNATGHVWDDRLGVPRPQDAEPVNWYGTYDAGAFERLAPSDDPEA